MPRKKMTEEEKAARKVRMEEKQEAEHKESSRVEMTRENIPEPARFFEVGEHVVCGTHDKSQIMEIHDGGKFYYVRFYGIKKVYGKDTEYEQFSFIPWTGMFKLDSGKDAPQFSRRDDFRLNYSQRDVMGVLGIVYHFGLDFDPDYQRGYVWDEMDKVKLIDSIMGNVDIGKVVFEHRDYSEERLYGIIDGKQRITALCEFYEDRFSYRGYKYSEMCVRDREHFMFYPVPVATVEKMTQEQILRLFLRLNTGGKQMDQNHLHKVRVRLCDLTGEKYDSI